MAETAISGATPKNPALHAAGVSLSRTEQTFLDALIDLIAHTGRRGYPRTGDPHTGTEPTSRPEPDPDDPFGIVVPEYLLPKPKAPRVRPDPPKLTDLFSLGEACGLRNVDVTYLREWIVNQGVHWLTCENSGIDDDLEGKRVFRNPVVRRIINAAAELGICNGTTASKEEIADWYTQRIRNPHLDDDTRANAADKLAKLMGYYPDGGKGGGSANIQINFVNPYAQPPVVDAEVVEDAANA